MIYGKHHLEQCKKRVHDPAFSRPISELYIDYSKRGNITLVTKIKPKPN